MLMVLLMVVLVLVDATAYADVLDCQRTDPRLTSGHPRKFKHVSVSPAAVLRRQTRRRDRADNRLDGHANRHQVGIATDAAVETQSDGHAVRRESDRQ